MTVTMDNLGSGCCRHGISCPKKRRDSTWQETESMPASSASPSHAPALPSPSLLSGQIPRRSGLFVRESREVTDITVRLLSKDLLDMEMRRFDRLRQLVEQLSNLLDSFYLQEDLAAISELLQKSPLGLDLVELRTRILGTIRPNK